MRGFPTRSLAATGLAAAAFLACSSSDTPTAESSVPAATAAAQAGPTLTPQQSGTTNRLQAISPVSAAVAWASGTGGTYTLTTDGGRHWRAGVVPGAEALEFRDVQGISAAEAYLLSAGTGEDARVYHTSNGGATWQLQFQNHNAAAFYDCFAFWTASRGLAMADGVNGRFPVIRTEDGRHWDRIPQNLPAALPGEAAFAASGTCVTTFGANRAWIATGGAEHARILRTTDGGDSWKAFATPIVQGTPAAGIFTVDFRDADHGILAGGDLEQADKHTDNVAVSSDGGRTWRLAARTPFLGAAYGLTYVPTSSGGPDGRTVVITGPGGAAWSPDEGQTWQRIQGAKDYWAAGFANRHVGWLVGTEGRILKVDLPAVQ
jgi:photosystem II stability/assembly factor-like uncharacterized protein